MSNTVMQQSEHNPNHICSIFTQASKKLVELNKYKRAEAIH